MFVHGTQQLNIARYPERDREILQAWDSADTLLLKHLDELGGSLGSVLLVNDSWGALSMALAHHRPWILSDSYVALAGIRENFRRNGLDIGRITLLTSFDPLPGRVDVVALKVPKSLGLLDDQLHRIAPYVHGATVVVAAGMTRHIHMSTLDSFTKILGPTRTSHAERKARLIFCTPDPGGKRPPNPWPRTYTVTPGGEVVISHAGVFSAERLDGGTRLLLEHLPSRRTGPRRIADLGCGNGILGTRAAIRFPEAEITFIDDSYRAVASAGATFRANLGSERTAHFVAGNGFFDGGAGAEAGGFDLVLNNPPFHQGHAVVDAVARQMFAESRRALRPGGELRTVGNRHLGYRAALQGLFGSCEVVASNSHFVVLSSRNP